MVDDNGRVRVLDFGLARPTADFESARPDIERPERLADGRTPLAASLTHGFAGTPAYAAPEQFAGHHADARTDQFSFCVALWEALYGNRPYPGDTVQEIVLAFAECRPKAATGTTIPSWLRAVVERGLAVDPSQRWPTMRALAEALRNDPTKTRRRMVAGAVVVTALVATVVGMGVHRANVRAACEREGEAIGQVWNDTARTRFRQSLVATGSLLADGAADKAVPLIDEFAAEWQASRTAVCLDARLSGKIDDRTALLARDCLGRIEEELSQLEAGLVARGEAGVLAAVSAAAGLTNPRQCQDVTRLLAMPAPPEDEAMREQIAALRAEISTARIERFRGEPDSAIGRLMRARDHADKLDWGPARLEVRMALGHALVDTRRVEEAEVPVIDAVILAIAAGDDLAAARASILLAQVVSRREGQVEAAMVWARFADASLERAGEPDPTVRANWAGTMLQLAMRRGELEQARDYGQRAVALSSEAHGPDHLEVAAKLNNLSGIHAMLGEYTTALSVHSRALTIERATLPAGHPSVVWSLNNHGHIYEPIDTDEAIKFVQQAVEAAESAHGVESPLFAEVLTNLGKMQVRAGHRDEGHATLRRALDRLAAHGAAFDEEIADVRELVDAG